MVDTPGLQNALNVGETKLCIYITRASVEMLVFPRVADGEC